MSWLLPTWEVSGYEGKLMEFQVYPEVDMELFKARGILCDSF